MDGVYLIDSDWREIKKAEQVLALIENGVEIIGSNTDPFLAVDEIAALQPELVILGTSKPQTQGVAFMKALRKAGVHCELAVLTTWWSTDSMGDFFYCGGFDYLLKPLDKNMAEKLLSRFARKRMKPG